MLLAMGFDLTGMSCDLSPCANASNTIALWMVAHLIGLSIDEDVTDDGFTWSNIAAGIVPSVHKCKDDATTTQSC